MKKKVLFICTHNSARSQMAEGLLNHLCGSKYEAYSTGTEPSIVNPYAIRVLAEIDIDISGNRSKGIEEFQTMKFDYVVTVCDNAKETCPFFPRGKKYIHKSFDDPSGVEGEDSDNKLAIFKKVRNEIMDWVKETFEL
ncbi:MAG: arsenate reductase ArsC [Candidatus Scalindua sp.]|nr:arsenate reductase ArsC [Candidatus Scalindua sp.]MCR4343327.1 arsenate reductase ArsC [Candidatus Scalindua sp.]